MTYKITTPDGGEPQYLRALALRDKIIGSITFTSNEDKKIFMEAYSKIEHEGFGSVTLEIDTIDSKD